MTADATAPAALDPAGGPSRTIGHSPRDGERPNNVSPLRHWTPDRASASGGTTITVKRACNGCGALLGDVTEREVERAIAGQPIEDVRAECPTCRPSLDRFHPGVVRIRVLDRLSLYGPGRVLAGAYTDPGQYCTRIREEHDGHVDYEPVHDWASRAVTIVAEVVQAEAERQGSVKVLRALGAGSGLPEDVCDGLADLADRIEKRAVTL